MKVIIITGAIIIIVTSSLFFQYNHTPSIATGWYYSTPFFNNVKKGDIIGFVLPDEVHQTFVSDGINIPAKLDLLKRVVATRGDQVCVYNNNVKVNRVIIARWEPYGLERLMKTGCYNLLEGQFFVMGDVKTSLDSRFIGIVRKEDIDRVGFKIH